IPSLPPANATMLIRGSISRMYCYESPLTRPAALKNCCHKIGGACSAPHSHPDLQLSRNFLCLQPPCLLFPIPRRGYLIAYHSVGQKEPNNFGLYDIHGNVWQWCQDRYDYYTINEV